MKKSNIILILVFTMLLGPIGSLCAESISFTLNTNPYEIIRDSEGFDHVNMEGYRPTGAPGNPLLPFKVFNILVPPDIIWGTLELSINGIVSDLLPGTFNIRPAAPDAAGVDGSLIYSWGSSKNILDEKDMDIYGEDAFYPAECLCLLPYSQLRKWKYTKVGFYPLQYNPVSGQLKLISSAEVEISFQRSAEKTSSKLLNDKVMDHLAPDTFHNYKSGLQWYAPSETNDRQGLLEDSNSKATQADQPNVTYDYVIITTNAIVSNSQKLAGFISHKTSRGFSVLVVTETDFGGLTGKAPDHKAEKIRQWLINNYSTYGIEYVLLIGNPCPYEYVGGEGDIPMKMCWPRYGAGSDENSPTDGFYADLTGNWDIDGDGYYGEWSDYTALGGVDFAMEVWVGRIPVYSPDYTTLDSILQKIINYEKSAATGWRKNILLPMGFQDVGYDGAPLGEQMRDDYLVPRGRSAWRQYQQGSGACSLDSACSSEEELRGGTVVMDRWAANHYGIVCWWGHGSATSTIVGYTTPTNCNDGTLFSSSQASVLDDTHPSFTYQCSCTNGYPEDSSNLQYSILKKGGISTVSASRVSWFNDGVFYGDFDGSSTNSGIGYEYVERLTRPLPGGRALYEAKLAVVPDLSYDTRLMNQYDFNLYGDPSVMAAIVGGLPFLPLLLLGN
ncbi:MAG TPA: C25 family cysteine peptidase [Desulfobacteraceae bacterium]|nr:C25 family cysteine peptidase [Desulfobacteraceae bacterium]HPJ68753.1 C25 family cysteine peptidase [Desulfobacteraceae bacterium]HPQ29854.1 C25 family cysteine peptidase [Desulfobacteraceae bacterium]